MLVCTVGYFGKINGFFFLSCEIFMLFSVNIHEHTLPCFVLFFSAYQKPEAGLAPLIIEVVGPSTGVRGGVQHEGHLRVRTWVCARVSV